MYFQYSNRICSDWDVYEVQGGPPYKLTGSTYFSQTHQFYVCHEKK